MTNSCQTIQVNKLTADNSLKNNGIIGHEVMTIVGTIVDIGVFRRLSPLKTIASKFQHGLKTRKLLTNL